MIGVFNRLAGTKCEVGTCFLDAAFTERIRVIPGSPALRDERHDIDIVLCRHHDDQFGLDGLVGIVTAYGDQIVSKESIGATCPTH